MVHEYVFECPLPNGLHARPASQLADVASRFVAEITLTNERTGTSANAKSVLAMVATDVKRGDGCRVRIAGADAEPARAALCDFVTNVLPGCDEPLPEPQASASPRLPRALRRADVSWLGGTIGCAGLGQGCVVPAGGLSLPAELAAEPAGNRAAELEKVNGAMAAVRANLKLRLAARPGPVETSILEAHLSIAADVALAEKIAELVAAGRAAGPAIVEAATFFAARLKSAESGYIRERAVDVEDIGLQLLEQVYGARFKTAGIELTQPAVVVAENLTPRQLLALDRRHLQALVLEHGGTTSHAVILARSFNIPTLSGVTDARARLTRGREAIVDAHLGIVIVEPVPPVRRYYERKQQRLDARAARLARDTHAPAVTRDGHRLEVAANVSTTAEFAPAFAQGADGIGLFRTEMLFLDRDVPPSEEEQYTAYVQAARAAAGRPVIIRTIDIGGDKPVPYLNLPPEANPFLGYRGVRIYSAHRAVFNAQLRAILRAAACGQVWLMVPMISSLDEVRWVRGAIREVAAELRAAGQACNAELPVGIMVEVPSAAFIMAQLAPEVDFFSIGTNDLAQYFLAVDRNSDQVGVLYSARHPGFLRLLAQIVTEGHRHGRWVGMCGEMTRAPQNLPLLIGLGLDEISTAAPGIPALKAAIARFSAAECRTLLEQALACGTVTEVEDAVAAFRARAGAQTLLDDDLIVVDSESASKEEALEELVDAFHAAGRTDQPQLVEEAIWLREAVYTTGLGHGFAVPHCKTDAITANSIGVLRLKKPIAWDAVDDQPVQCVILLVVRAAEDGSAHMKIFSRLARKLMHDEFRARLLAAPERAALRRYLATELGLTA